MRRVMSADGVGSPEADGEIETVAHQVPDAVPRFDAKLHLRVLQEELAQLRRQDDAREQGIDIDPQPAADRISGFRSLRRRLADARQVLDDALIKRASLVGEFDSAARAVNQSGAEARLKLGDRFADAGLRHAQPFGGFAKAAGVSNGSKNDQAANQSTINFVHSRCLSVI
jgi:hypothetical protein